MSQYHVGATCDLTFVAEADLSDYQYHIVKFGSADNGCDVATSASGMLGVLQNAPESGQQALVRVHGPSKCILDGTTDIAAGDRIVATTGGVGIKATSGLVLGRSFHAYTDTADIPVEIFVEVYEI